MGSLMCRVKDKKLKDDNYLDCKNCYLVIKAGDTHICKYPVIRTMKYKTNLR
jgi:hypothetical protein